MLPSSYLLFLTSESYCLNLTKIKANTMSIINIHAKAMMIFLRKKKMSQSTARTINNDKIPINLMPNGVDSSFLRLPTLTTSPFWTVIQTVSPFFIFFPEGSSAEIYTKPPLSVYS